MGYAAQVRASAAEEHLYVHPSLHKSGHYQIMPPSGTGPAGVLVFFHGSGGGSAYAAQMELLARAAQAFNLAVVALEAPDRALSWAADLPRIGALHTEYVRDLLATTVFGPHPSWSRERTVFVGYSAGSTFLAGDFLPDAVEHFRGGALLLCGGGMPLNSTKENTAPLSADVRQHFKMYYVIQTGDFLFNQATAGFNLWKSRGMKVAGESPAGGSHCGFDLGKALRDGLRYVFSS